MYIRICMPAKEFIHKNDYLLFIVFSQNFPDGKVLVFGVEK